MGEKREKVKLTEKQFELLRPRYQVGEQNVIGMLLDHIDVMEAEQATAKYGDDGIWTGAIDIAPEDHEFWHQGYEAARKRFEAEQQAVASCTASDAFEVGHANATFIEQQTKHIQALEMGIKDILTAVEIDGERHDIRFTINDQTFAWDTSEPISNPLVKAILALRFLVKDVSK